MIGRYTSTSVTTLVKKGAAALRAPRLLPRIAKIRLALGFQRALSTAPPPHPVLRGPRSTRSLPPPNFTQARSVRYGSPSYGAGRPRGGVQNVGLGKARTFATAPPVGSVKGAAQNVPVVLRAFAQLLDDDDLPRPTRYAPYAPRRARKDAALRSQSRLQRRERYCPSASAASMSSTEAKIRDLAAYFPLPCQRKEAEVPLPPTPELLLTPGHVTTLNLALAPSLEALLDPTPGISYADAEVGVAILAGLTQGLMPLHEAYSAAGARVIPLLSRLDALGVLDPRGFPATTLEVSLDADGNPDILRVVFAERCADDVRELLGELVDIGVLTQRAVLSANEVDAMRAPWASEERPRLDRRRSSRRTLTYEAERVHELVMPSMDVSSPGVESWPRDSWEPSASFPPSSSGVLTPDTFDVESLASSPQTPSDWESSPPGSLLSSLEDQSLERSYAWSVYPSENDSVVESWREVVPSVQIREQEVEVGWVEFGLMQSW